MTKKLNWRLSKLPTPDEVRELVKDKIITQEEAREILFSLQTDEDRDNESLKSEIKFLRELVEKLSNNSLTKIVEIIREVEKPWRRYSWYDPYVVWCNNGSLSSYTNIPASTGGSFTVMNTASNFSDIKTF